MHLVSCWHRFVASSDQKRYAVEKTSCYPGMCLPWNIDSKGDKITILYTNRVFQKPQNPDNRIKTFGGSFIYILCEFWSKLVCSRIWNVSASFFFVFHGVLIQKWENITMHLFSVKQILRQAERQQLQQWIQGKQWLRVKMCGSRYGVPVSNPPMIL